MESEMAMGASTWALKRHDVVDAVGEEEVDRKPKSQRVLNVQDSMESSDTGTMSPWSKGTSSQARTARIGKARMASVLCWVLRLGNVFWCLGQPSSSVLLHLPRIVQSSG